MIRRQTTSHYRSRLPITFVIVDVLLFFKRPVPFEISLEQIKKVFLQKEIFCLLQSQTFFAEETVCNLVDFSVGPHLPFWDNVARYSGWRYD